MALIRHQVFAGNGQPRAGELIEDGTVEVSDALVNADATRAALADSARQLRLIRDTGSFTVAQRDDAIRTLAAAILRIGRIVLQDHEEAE
jgi:hypothetical protein